MNDEKALQAFDQRTVTFYDDELVAIRADDGRIYVVIRHMCDALGIDPQAQTRRIRRHAVLGDGYQRVAIMTTHRGRQVAGMLRADLTPLWLSGVQASRVAEEMQEKLIRFQREAAAVLWEAFQEGRLTDPDFSDLVGADPDALEALAMARAVVKLAESHARLSAQFAGHEMRLEAIESQLGDPKRQITPAQATELKDAVKAIALHFSRRSGRNEYGSVWGEFQRYFEVNSYLRLPASRFDEALEWLNDWLQQLIGDSEF